MQQILSDHRFCKQSFFVHVTSSEYKEMRKIGTLGMLGNNKWSNVLFLEMNDAIYGRTVYLQCGQLGWRDDKSLILSIITTMPPLHQYALLDTPPTQMDNIDVKASTAKTTNHPTHSIFNFVWLILFDFFKEMQHMFFLRGMFWFIINMMQYCYSCCVTCASFCIKAECGRNKQKSLVMLRKIVIWCSSDAGPVWDTKSLPKCPECCLYSPKLLPKIT